MAQRLKASASNAGDLGSIPGSGRHPGEGNGNPLQYSCLENPMDGGLVGYSPRGRKESDTTERLHLLTYLLMTNNVEHLFHVLICHLLLSFSEQFKSFAHYFFFIVLLVFLLLNVENSLHTSSGFKPLLYILFVITSSQSMACFSIL